MASAQTTSDSAATTAGYLRLAALLSLLAGLGVGLWALAGPAAVWLGLGDFRVGFGLLRQANSWAGWVALASLAVTVGILVFGVLRSRSGSGKLAALAGVGTLAAALVWYVPQTFRPPEGTPAIHDIATDPYNPLPFVAIVPLRADAPNNLEYGVMPGVDSVQEHIDLQLAAYPDIEPQVFDQPASAVFARALAAVDTLGWELVDTDPDSGRIEATDTTFWFRFKDDVVISVRENASGQTVVQARSVSRVGRSDVGKNAARLREFFALLR
jgi:hypothetical protein